LLWVMYIDKNNCIDVVVVFGHVARCALKRP